MKSGGSDASQRGAVPPATAAIRLEGEFWSLSFGERTIRMKDSRGLRYLARLIESPGRETHALDLVGSSLVEPASTDAIDAEARSAYAARLRELEQEIDDADSVGDAVVRERLSAERDGVLAQLGAAYGLGGRARRSASSPAERARKAVTERIRTTLARIERLHPPLGAHLRHSVRTGAFCSYVPSDPVDWAPVVDVAVNGVRVMLVDDHPLWRGTLRQVLEHERAGAVVAEASDGPEAVDVALQVRPDVVVMDMALPGMSGADATRALVAAWPEVKVLVLSSSDERDSVVAALASGALGYVVKTADAGQIADAVRRVRDGELVLPPALARVVLEELRR